MKKLVFYKCEICGNVVIKLIDKNVPVFCCGKIMQEIIPNTQEGAVEKHVPVVKQKENIISVSVGEVAHPMNEEHYITHIICESEKGFSVQTLSPNDKPECTFVLQDGDKLKNVYCNCNLHGIWKN